MTATTTHSSTWTTMIQRNSEINVNVMRCAMKSVDTLIPNFSISQQSGQLNEMFESQLKQQEVAGKN